MISRRRFFRLAETAILAFLGYAGYRSVVDAGRTRPPNRYVFTGPVPEGFSFSGPVILHNRQGQIRFFSSSCAHLGCRISSLKDDRLVCPCHGSEYDQDGKVVKGPAISSLRELPFTLDPETGEMIIQL